MRSSVSPNNRDTMSDESLAKFVRLSLFRGQDLKVAAGLIGYAQG
jgi:hypothetical protein